VLAIVMVALIIVVIIVVVVVVVVAMTVVGLVVAVAVGIVVMIVAAAHVRTDGTACGTACCRANQLTGTAAHGVASRSAASGTEAAAYGRFGFVAATGCGGTSGRAADGGTDDGARVATHLFAQNCACRAAQCATGG
jgi:hypothetical protein